MTGKMISSRYKKSGWFGDSHRHYLASKGVKTTWNVGGFPGGRLANKARWSEQELFESLKRYKHPVASDNFKRLSPEHQEIIKKFSQPEIEKTLSKPEIVREQKLEVYVDEKEKEEKE